MEIFKALVGHLFFQLCKGNKHFKQRRFYLVFLPVTLAKAMEMAEGGEHVQDLAVAQAPEFVEKCHLYGSCPPHSLPNGPLPGNQALLS